MGRSRRDCLNTQQYNYRDLRAAIAYMIKEAIAFYCRNTKQGYLQ
ncbi:hypothetical protein [Nostoc sp. CENA543]|nr:hypothetical protein [Nostoc sp. CENA543]